MKTEAEKALKEILKYEPENIKAKELLGTF